MTLILPLLPLALLSPGEPEKVVSAPTPSQVARAERLLEASPSQRIRSRNLFHPTRGVMPSGEGAAAAEAAWPSLKGTQMGKGHRGALLMWPGKEEAVFLAEGETFEGLRLAEIHADRVRLVEIKGGAGHVLEMDADRREESASASELEQLFKRPAPAVPKRGPQ